MLQVFTAWKYKKRGISPEQRMERRNLALIMKLKPVRDVDFTSCLNSDTVLLTGDGHTLPNDVRAFEAFGVKHDVYCVNRSALYFQRPINHWGAVDAEESMWFSEHCNGAIKPPGHTIVRHTFGDLGIAYDVGWEVDEFEYETELQKHIWLGNTGYFGILTSIAMGYDKIVLAGMPMDGLGHWYEHPEDTPAPQWLGKCYQQWMDFKTKVADSVKVRSMGGYSAFILGEATREWINGE